MQHFCRRDLRAIESVDSGESDMEIIYMDKHIIKMGLIFLLKTQSTRSAGQQMSVRL